MPPPAGMPHRPKRSTPSSRAWGERQGGKESMKQLMKHTEAHANSLLWVGGARRCWNHVGASLDTWQAAAHCLLVLQLPPAVVWDRCAPGCAAPVPQTQGPGSVPRLRTRRVQLDSWEVPSTHTHTPKCRTDGSTQQPAVRRADATAAAPACRLPLCRRTCHHICRHH